MALRADAWSRAARASIAIGASTCITIIGCWSSARCSSSSNSISGIGPRSSGGSARSIHKHQE